MRRTRQGIMGLVMLGAMGAGHPAAADGLATSILLGEALPDGERAGVKVAPGKLHAPFGVDFDQSGTMTIVELEGGRVHQLSAAGAFQTIAGDGSRSYRGDGGPAKNATFNGMHNVAISAENAIYISDSWNHCVRKIDAKSGVVSTFAGTGEAGFSGDGGPAAKATFDYIMCISFGPAKKHLYLADLRNRRIRKIDMATGIVTTVAGNGEKGVPRDGAMAIESPLVDPRAVAVNDAGMIHVLERGGHALRVVDREGKVRTVPGTGEGGYRDGPALEAQLKGPKHLCFDAEQRVIIADEQNNVIRRYDPGSGQVETILGRGVGEPARYLSKPHGVCFHKGRLYVVDTGHQRVLKAEAPLDPLSP